MDQTGDETVRELASVAFNGTMVDPEQEWREILDATDTDLRAAVAEMIHDRSAGLSHRFYTVMMTDQQAGAFLDHQLVEQRLGRAMQQWLIELFAVMDPAQSAAAVAHQKYVGATHARIKLPINLVSRGARFFKHWIWAALAEDARFDRERLPQAVIYVNDLIDLAIEIMTAAFMTNADRAARTEEAYRLFSLSQDLAIERERQRASLLEWGQQIMSALYRHPLSNPPRIGQSEFGLWLVHKALFMFEHSTEVEQIVSIADRIDSQLVPRLTAALDSGQMASLFTQMEDEISQIKFLLSSLFDRYLEVENGRDVLTKLFNRRFLPSALMREIDLAKRSDHAFALMLIDIDHFKQVNDSYGHEAGDVVLQQTAALIMNSIRAGDFVFRYGGEEILVILVDVDRGAVLRLADAMRMKIEQARFMLSGGRSINLTVSIGVASYDGHPDYQVLINQADTALYEAKSRGRNCCVLATPA